MWNFQNIQSRDIGSSLDITSCKDVHSGGTEGRLMVATRHASSPLKPPAMELITPPPKKNMLYRPKVWKQVVMFKVDRFHTTVPGHSGTTTSLFRNVLEEPCWETRRSSHMEESGKADVLKSPFPKNVPNDVQMVGTPRLIERGP